MATEANQLTPLEQCKQYILSKDSFVLQGGAGSGKTETLKELLLLIKQNTPNARVICITHTNVAVDEIASRVGEDFLISTIHSFINNLIKDYKKNVKSVISNIFIIKEMARGIRPDELSEAEYKKLEHEKYKKIHEKYTGKLFNIKEETFSKPIGKKEYDKDPEKYNNLLNLKIRELNADIIRYIEQYDYTKIEYNETKFNSYSNLSYGHDGLLDVFHLLFKKYPILRKMIVDKFDCLFIDEYQDTHSNVIADLISLSENKKLIVGLFGDSMQAIYSDGIGDVKGFIDSGNLHDVPKPDNFRCSYEVLQLINPLRLDGIQQSVAFKTLSEGRIETENDRHGNTKVLYSICKNKPTAYSSFEEKQQYQEYVNEVIVHAQSLVDDYKILLLTNKSISQKNNFEHLYKIFDDRFSDVNDRIENYLKRIQALDVCDICQLYQNKNYNPLIKQIRSGGYLIRTGQDKLTLKNHVEHLMTNADLSLWQAVEYAKANKLIKQTETCLKTIKRNSEILNQLKSDNYISSLKYFIIMVKILLPKFVIVYL
jgi:DNA helicase II / ATP-dependent DNA helicase PcrA